MKDPKPVHKLRLKIFADGAEKDGMLALAKEPFIKGFTTNPTLMKKAGITDYAAFAKDILASITKKPISFEVFSDDFDEMERQARIINAWGENIYVKIPVTNTKKKSAAALVRKLSHEGIRLNVTALLTLVQVKEMTAALSPKTPAIISVFAGRIADTGYDPLPIMKAAKAITLRKKNIELLWASPRQLFDIYNAEAAGADIITVTHDVLKKLDKIGYDHTALSLDTVKMFYDDGQKVGYTLYEA
ncbi:MAG: transaldolase [Patescibacteria group bacterium]